MSAMEETSSKSTVVKMMERRDRERKLVIEKNLKARQEKSEVEGVDYFDGVFEKKALELDTRINMLESTSDITALQDVFTSIANELKELQNYFTSSTIFLSDHKIKTCQNTLNQLLLKCDEQKAISLPKKKFGFKNKTAKIEIIETQGEDEKVMLVEKLPRKEFEWTDSQKSNVILKYENEAVNDKDLTFKEIENCVVIINGHAGSLQMSQIKNCLVLCGPVARSVFADNCENCTFAFTCQQLRLHTSSACDIYIRVTSRAIIEDCKDIKFAPSTYAYENYDAHMDAAGLDKSVNNWTNVGDFNWLSTDKPSPNWTQIDESCKISDWADFIDNFISKHKISSL